MNYDNINDIFSAGVTNMTCLLQDSNSYDGGTLAVSGADFFTFLGKAVPYIYAHGDSYWGIGSDATHLKVDNRDTRTEGHTLTGSPPQMHCNATILPTVFSENGNNCIKSLLPCKAISFWYHGRYFPSYDFCSCAMMEVSVLVQTRTILSQSPIQLHRILLSSIMRTVRPLK